MQQHQHQQAQQQQAMQQLLQAQQVQQQQRSAAATATADINGQLAAAPAATAPHSQPATPGRPGQVSGGDGLWVSWCGLVSHYPCGHMSHYLCGHMCSCHTRPWRKHRPGATQLHNYCTAATAEVSIRNACNCIIFFV